MSWDTWSERPQGCYADHGVREVGEDVDYVAMPKASCQWASVLLYLGKAGYDIKLVDNDDFTRVMSHVKWSFPNPSGSNVVNRFDYR